MQIELLLPPLPQINSMQPKRHFRVHSATTCSSESSQEPRIEQAPAVQGRAPVLPPLREVLNRSYKRQLHQEATTRSTLPAGPSSQYTTYRHPHVHSSHHRPARYPAPAPAAAASSSASGAATFVPPSPSPTLPSVLAHEYQCKARGCYNRAQVRGFCKAHSSTRCKVEGCTKTMQRKGLCRAHGGGKQCEVEGCEKAVQRFNRCHAHGGIRYCRFEGCKKKDRGSGFCVAHGGGSKCAIEGCDRLARKQKRCTQHLRLLG